MIIDDDFFTVAAFCRLFSILTTEKVTFLLTGSSFALIFLMLCQIISIAQETFQSKTPLSSLSCVARRSLLHVINTLVLLCVEFICLHSILKILLSIIKTHYEKLDVNS